MVLRLGAICCLFSLAIGAPANANRQASAPRVTIDSGVVVGTYASVTGKSSPVAQYLGVPFAASPTRFAPAQTPTPWGVYEATQRGPACIQQFNYPEATRNFTIAAFNTPAPPESEDCLSVNIFAPAAASSTNLKTVMFWIYGDKLRGSGGLRVLIMEQVAHCNLVGMAMLLMMEVVSLLTRMWSLCPSTIAQMVRMTH